MKPYLTVLFATALLRQQLASVTAAVTNYSPGTSVCILPSGNRSTSASECSTGEIFLIGQYVNLGIHNCGSFGTKSKLTTDYYDDRLGFLADYDKNGFVSTTGEPGFAGDYFVAGSPLEGECFPSHTPVTFHSTVTFYSVIIVPHVSYLTSSHVSYHITVLSHRLAGTVLSRRQLRHHHSGLRRFNFRSMFITI